MIKEKLKTYKIHTGYNLAQLEIDYLQHVFLQLIYDKCNTIYFKGGTCLQKCFGLKRFSEDLDFNYEQNTPKDILAHMQKYSPYDFEVKDYKENRFGTTIRISIKGILFDGTDATKCKLSFDFRKGDTYQEVQRILIHPLYEDILNYTVLTLSKEEILAEKIRAIMTRNQGRDVFDTFNLLKQGVPLDSELINKKVQTYEIVFNREDFKDKLHQKKKVYTSEMSSLVKEFPSFEECEKEIMQRINNIV